MFIVIMSDMTDLPSEVFVLLPILTRWLMCHSMLNEDAVS